MSSLGVFWDVIADPVDGSGLERDEGNCFRFAGGRCYPVHDGVPILIDESTSLFRVDEIEQYRVTTQDCAYRDQSRLKNYIRQRWLPALSSDTKIASRYTWLGQLVKGGRILVLGAGDKACFYRECFRGCEVLTSDVHALYDPDVVFDAHQIPFREGTFDLVLAGQVLEHTARPWQVASEIQRVTRIGGLVQVEVPFVFPFHAAPYDFYRFTPTALRFLFPRAEILTLKVTEGVWSAAAVCLAQALIDSFAHTYARRAALVLARFSFGWIKLLDKIVEPSVNMPKGFAVTYRITGLEHSNREMLKQVQDYL